MHELTPPLARVLAAVQGARPTRHGYEAHCPAHDDRHRSLTIDTGADGRALLKCHAGDGCPAEAIVAALGLTLADLFADAPHRHGPAPAPRIVATYDYPDEDGTLLYQVVRYQPKDFRQRRPDGRGGWAWKLGGVRRVLYRLPALQAADPSAPVFKPEGEKDADNLAALGLVATTNAGGAAKWRPEYTRALAGRPIVLLPDNDAAGRADTAQVAAALYGVAAWVKVVALPDLPEHGDVSDWLAAGGTRAQLLELVAATPLWEPPDLVARLTRAERERDDATATLSAVMGVLHRADLSPTEKVVGAITVAEQLQYQRAHPLAPTDPDCSREARAVLADGYQLAPPQVRVAKAAAVSRGTVARCWKALGDLKLLDRKEASVRRREVDYTTGEILAEGWTKRTFLRLAGDGATHEAYSPLATAPEDADRRKRQPRPKPLCAQCGTDEHVHWRAVPVCDLHGVTAAGAAPPAPPEPPEPPESRMYQIDTFGAAPESSPATTYPVEVLCANELRSDPAAVAGNPALSQARTTKFDPDTFGTAPAAGAPPSLPPGFTHWCPTCLPARRTPLTARGARCTGCVRPWRPPDAADPAVWEGRQ